MGSVGSWDFLVDFEFYMAVLGARRGPIGLVSPWKFKILDSEPDTSNMDPFQTNFYDFDHFPNSYVGFLARYLSCFRPGCFQKCNFDVFGRNQKDARQKVMQIRGGITSRSALFDLFMAV